MWFKRQSDAGVCGLAVTGPGGEIRVQREVRESRARGTASG